MVIMASMLKKLRSQGVEAYPVLVSTRNNGIPLFPTREGFNYVICMVQSGDSSMLIDATEPYSSNNVLPERVLNWQGRVIEENGVSSWVNILPKKRSVESTMLNVKMEDDFSVSGKVSKNFTSYLALNYRKKYAGVTQEDRQYPIDFVIPYEDKFLINILLPMGYKVESLPTSEAMEFKGGAAKFQYIIQKNGQYLQLKVVLEINNPIIDPMDYEVFKDFYEKIIEKQAEQIVLTKA